MDNFLGKRVNFCPNCLGESFENINSKYLNVYSELISKKLGISEDSLIKKMSPLKCKECELKFWKHPLNENIRFKLYTEILPIHPKGEDSSGQFFNFEGLKNKLKNKNENPSKTKRIIDGYLSSIKFRSLEEYKRTKNQLIHTNDYQKIKNELIDLFERGPLDFSRHAGFRNTILSTDILEVIKKNKPNALDYIEYGSLDWGPINSDLFESFRCLHIIPNNDIFWNNKRKLIDGSLKHNHILEKNMFSKSNDYEDSSLGLILIIDHLVNPYVFLRKFVNRKVKNIFILVEREEENKGLPVQHLTLWNKKSLKVLGERLGFRSDFPKINAEKYIYAKLSLKPELKN